MKKYHVTNLMLAILLLFFSEETKDKNEGRQVIFVRVFKDGPQNFCIINVLDIRRYQYGISRQKFKQYKYEAIIYATAT